MRAARTPDDAPNSDTPRAGGAGAGAFLPIHCLAGAVDLAAVLYLMRAAPALGELPDHAAVNNVGAWLKPENGVGQRDRAGLLAVEGGDLHFHHALSPLPAAWPPA